ncbi:MAG: hypothetical protein WC740_03605 [Verrucomicrobiia bacterium]
MNSPGGIQTSSIPVDVVMVFSWAKRMAAGVDSSSTAATAKRLTRFMISSVRLRGGLYGMA